MRKLYKLKSWYSLEDAATRLSLTLSEPVTINDIRQLMAEGHIAPYWNIHHLHAVEVAPITYLYRSGDLLLEMGKAQGLLPAGMAGMACYGFERQTEELETLDGIYKIDCENVGASMHWLKAIAAGKENEYTSLDGTILIGQDDKFWQLLTKFPGAKHKPWSNLDNFYPNFELPEDSEIVISKLELENFEAQFIVAPENDKPLKERERNTFLRLIKVLCTGQDLDLKQPYKDADIIKQQAERAGIQIDLETIANKLKEAKKS